MARARLARVGIPIVVMALFVAVAVFWATTWRLHVSTSSAEQMIATEPPTLTGAVGTPSVSCHASGGFLGLSRTEDCTLAYRSGNAFHCRVWNPDEGVGDGMRCDPTPFRTAAVTRA